MLNSLNIFMEKLRDISRKSQDRGEKVLGCDRNLRDYAIYAFLHLSNIHALTYTSSQTG